MLPKIPGISSKILGYVAKHSGECHKGLVLKFNDRAPEHDSLLLIYLLLPVDFISTKKVLKQY